MGSHSKHHPMKDKDFVQKFSKGFNLVKSGKLPGIQLSLGQLPGETIANKGAPPSELNATPPRFMRTSWERRKRILGEPPPAKASSPPG